MKNIPYPAVPTPKKTPSQHADVSTSHNDPQRLEQAKEALYFKRFEEAYKLFKSIVETPQKGLITPDQGRTFSQAALGFSNLSMILGREREDILRVLEQAEQAAAAIGDQRSLVLIHLHRGRLFFFQNEQAKAVDAFSVGKDRAEELGDPDIHEQADTFTGLNYFLQGRHRTAIDYLDHAVAISSHINTDTFQPLVPIVFGLCASYLGRFQRALGVLDFGWNVLKRTPFTKYAVTTRVILGGILLIAGDRKSGLEHLDAARAELRQGDNSLGAMYALRVLANHHRREGDHKRARELLLENRRVSERSTVHPPVVAPWVLETYFELEQRGLAHGLGWSFPAVYQSLMDGPNVHLQGVVKRLQAQKLAAESVPPSDIRSLLESSEQDLTIAGDPIQLAKTRFALARIELGDAELQVSHPLVQRACESLRGVDEKLLPAGLKSLIGERDAESLVAQQSAEVDRVVQMLHRLAPELGTEGVLSEILSLLNRLFDSQRAAFFWKEHPKGAIELRARHGLTEAEITSEEFRPHMKLVTGVFHSGKTSSISDGNRRSRNSKGEEIAVAIPVLTEGKTQGVVYCDNAFTKTALAITNRAMLDVLERAIAAAMDRHLAILRYLEKVKHTALEISFSTARAEDKELITQSPIVQKVLKQAGRIARSDASVLLLGETGVGKGVLAEWIHRRSDRRDNPFVVVDPSTLPTGLVESELFGHEKGAFTGANRQKAGLLEPAHQGTLFIDEIGEIPTSTQVKLLRVLQEKSFTRIGGVRRIHSEFRLIAATNRDLAAEVAAGRFREDLYYRLNVISFTLPPLKKRGDDSIMLAEHFLGRFMDKYSRPHLVLSDANKTEIRQYHWPGNVRELLNVIERAVLLSENDELNLNLRSPVEADSNSMFGDSLSLDDLQRRYITHVLKKTGGKVSGPGGAAEALGMKRSTLIARMKKLGVTRMS